MRTIKHHDDGSEIKWNYVLTFIHSNMLFFLCKTDDEGDAKKREEIVTSVVNDDSVIIL